jgi:pre-mRNA-splicing factor RBM22/SLT11
MLCETCLGPNPYVRMIALPPGRKLCKISSLPFKCYRWKPDASGRYKETVISLLVAKERNLCQACLKDMQFDLPAGVRDRLLRQQQSSEEIAIPQSEVGQAYYYQTKAINGTDAASNLSFSTLQAQGPAIGQLQSFAASHASSAMRGNSASSSSSSAVAATIPWRNLPKLCSFWINGKCTRVAKKSCPYRPCCGPSAFVFPEIASTNREIHHELQEQLHKHGANYIMKHISKEAKDAIQKSLRGVNRDEAIRKRVNGEDELTQRYVNRIETMNQPINPPDDPSITTLWLGGIEADVTEEEIVSATYAYGQVLSIHIARAAKCAFVEYASREMAVYAINQLANRLFLRGRPVHVKWAKPRSQGGASASATVDSEAELLPPPGLEHAPSSSYAITSSKKRSLGGEELDQEQSQRGKKASLTLPSSDPLRLGSAIP